MELVNGDIHLTKGELAGRSFLLGNKRAFSLSLPVAPGTSDAVLHPHKWFGACHYGRKYLEGQVVRARGRVEHFMGNVVQTGFTMTSTQARREYQVEGEDCSEEFFVPDGLQAMACTFSGNLEFFVEPEFDLRLSQALSQSVEGYHVEEIDRGVIVSNVLPHGTYDDLTETFVPDGGEATRIFAAVQIMESDGWAELLPPSRRGRRKIFRKDRQRHEFILHSAPEEAVHDHAPLWDQSGSRVFAPVRLHFQGHGTVVYGFGASREEALAQMSALGENLTPFQIQKAEVARDILAHASFHSGLAAVDTAYAQLLTRLMDALVARRVVLDTDTALDGPTTMILAGNQYFHDSWKRDENIALGFLLSLGFYDLARDVIRDTWQLQDERTGRLPQRIRIGEEPAYQSSDGTLWALHRLHRYWRCTGDDSILHDKLPMVETFFRRSLERTIQGMLPSGRTTAPDYLWETWMDTAHTPRDGFPVEIQMLWIACLRAYRPILRARFPELEQAMERAESEAWARLQGFNVRGLPADSLDAEGAVRDLITPNPYFCFEVGLDLGVDTEKRMREVGRRQLAGRQGIMTLAPEDWHRVFPSEFLLDTRRVKGRRMRSIGKYNYHRGVEWNWLSSFFVQAELKYGEPDVAFRRYLRKHVDAALLRGGIGGISELYDLSGTRGPEFQAWSMSAFLESVHAFTGVRIDVPERRIGIHPQAPDSWPEISARKWYGNIPFDMRYRRAGRTQSLRIQFPWGDPPDAAIEVSLVVPAKSALDFFDIRGDHTILEQPSWTPILGTDRARISCVLNPGGDIDITAGIRRTAARQVVSA